MATNSVYRTMQGREIDLDKLRIKNEMTLAVGNVKVNARGDELGPGGKIIKKREDVMTEYHTHADAVPTKAAKPAKAVAPTAPVVNTPDSNFEDFDSEEK
jgi:hypothetical protein